MSSKHKKERHKIQNTKKNLSTANTETKPERMAEENYIDHSGFEKLECVQASLSHFNKVKKFKVTK